MSEVTLRQLTDAFLAETAAERRASTNANYRYFYDYICRDFGTDIPLAQISVGMLRSWKMHLLARFKPGTVLKYCERLSTALDYAVECGWLDANPMRKVRRPATPPARVRFLSDAERARLLPHCRASRNPLLYPIVILALTTGGRKDELVRLQWPQVDFEAGVVRFLLTKNNRPRAVPLVGEAHAVLAELARHRKPAVPWVFPAWNGRGPTRIDSPWHVARREAGIPDFRFHDLRHTCASYLAMSGSSLRDIAEVLGHAKIQQSANYAHLTENHNKEIVDRMTQKFLPPPPPPDTGAQPA